MVRSELSARDGRGSRRFIVLKAVLSLAALGYVLSLVPIGELSGIARRVDWRLVAASIALSSIAGYLNALRMYYLSAHQGISLRPRELMAINFIASFYGLFMPGYLAGGAIRWYYMSRPDGKRAQALAAIVFNRVLETAMLIGLGIIFWLIETSEGERETSTIVLGAAALFSAAAYALVMSRRAHGALRRLIRFARTPQWLVAPLNSVQTGLETYSDRRWTFHAQAFGLALLQHALGVASLVLFVHALSIEVELATIGWVRSVLALALMLPISVGGFGVRELTLLTLLAPYGVSAAEALMLAVLILIRELVTAAIGGALVARHFLVPPRDGRPGR